MGDGIRIEFSEVGKRYDERVIFRGISGTVKPGSILVLTGPNGSGKSTLVSILCGLLRPTRGTVKYLVGDDEVERWEWRFHLGIVAPAMALYEELTAHENLRFFARVRDLKMDDDDLNQILETVGLDPRRTTPVVGFSTGMQQRLKIAQAMLHEPEVLFLDEPGANLDPGGQDWFEGWVAAYAAAGGTVVLATNDRREMQWGMNRVELAG
ncbi:MAG: heme ABC exporter ATP-binding protein CcmA [Thermoanaerobaculales bacterium]|nr:heme ABC exporter ATP-binding protein CcmA [Thermoanaerobaculales bacterium]